MEQLPITSKQIEILALLYRFRFLNRVQIQILLHHKDYRRINDWLKDLTEREYVGRVYSRKQVGINIPAIHFRKPKARKEFAEIEFYISGKERFVWEKVELENGN